MTIHPFDRQQLGPAVELAYKDALDDWLRYHSKGRSPEIMLTSEIRRVEALVQLRSARPGLIVVSIYARRKHDDASYPFDLRATPLSAYEPGPLG